MERVKEKKERNLEITAEINNWLGADEENTLNAIALKLAYKHDLTPERIKAIYKKYKAVISQ